MNNLEKFSDKELTELKVNFEKGIANDISLNKCKTMISELLEKRIGDIRMEIVRRLREKSAFLSQK